MAKIRIFTVLGLYSRLSVPINVKFGTRERNADRSPVPIFTFIVLDGAKNPFLDH